MLNKLSILKGTSCGKLRGEKGILSVSSNLFQTVSFQCIVLRLKKDFRALEEGGKTAFPCFVGHSFRKLFAEIFLRV